MSTTNETLTADKAKDTWHVLVIREWRSTRPMVLPVKKTFATEAEAEAVAERCRAEGPFHSRCLRETYHVVQSPKDIEWITCRDSGRRNLYINRADLAERIFKFPSR